MSEGCIGSCHVPAVSARASAVSMVVWARGPNLDCVVMSSTFSVLIVGDAFVVAFAI